MTCLDDWIIVSEFAANQTGIGRIDILLSQGEIGHRFLGFTLTYLIKIQPQKISDTVKVYPQAINRMFCNKNKAGSA